MNRPVKKAAQSNIKEMGYIYSCHLIKRTSNGIDILAAGDYQFRRFYRIENILRNQLAFNGVIGIPPWENRINLKPLDQSRSFCNKIPFPYKKLVKLFLMWLNVDCIRKLGKRSIHTVSFD